MVTTRAKDDTQQVLDMRQRLDTFKTRLTEARTKKTGAEDQLTAADDAIEELGLDPDRDLERQKSSMITKIQEDLTKLERYLDNSSDVLDGR